MALPRKHPSRHVPESADPERSVITRALLDEAGTPQCTAVRLVVCNIVDNIDDRVASVEQTEKHLFAAFNEGFQPSGPPVAVGTFLVYTLTRLEWKP